MAAPAAHPRTSSGTAGANRGLLAVSIEDQRLTWPERELIKQLGEKLYGTSRTAREI